MKITIKDVILVGAGFIAGGFYVCYHIGAGCVDGRWYVQRKFCDGTVKEVGSIIFDPSAKTEEETSE